MMNEREERGRPEQKRNRENCDTVGAYLSGLTFTQRKLYEEANAQQTCSLLSSVVLFTVSLHPVLVLITDVLLFPQQPVATSSREA